MTCDVCNTDIPRGKRYKGERYQQAHFCSESCYLSYIQSKDKAKSSNPLTKLTDYLSTVYENPNFPWLMRQIKALKKEYGLSENEIRMVIKYAIEYEDVVVNEDLGLGQFFPRYIDDALAFAQTIINNKEKAREMGDLVEPRVVCRSRDKGRKFKER